MERYYEAYMDDAVVRVAENGDRFIKVMNSPFVEIPARKGSKIAYGGMSYGIIHALEPISEERYRNFGITWPFSNGLDRKRYKELKRG